MDFPPATLIIYIIGSICVLALLIAPLHFAFRSLLGLYSFSPFEPAPIIASFFNISVFLLIWCLFYFGIHYFENYKKSEIERLIWEAAVKDFELKTLKSQLNPHFMFNALNSIRALVIDDPERAKTAITQLSNIFRYSLKMERAETVPFEEELKTVVDYLSLEKVRYEERLHFTIDTASNTKSVLIPPMMIQTLVENGIKHGISKLPEGGEVTVTANLKEDKLVLRITNTGSLDEEALKHTTGNGLANTKQRLHLLYGEDASFRIANDGTHVEAEIIIPTGGRKNESFIN